MAHLIYFRTARFDVTMEAPNPNNPVAGESACQWLRGELDKVGYRSTNPDHEDWGWYIEVFGTDTAYMVGVGAEVEYKDDEGPAFSYDVEPNASLSYTIQIHKRRTLKDKLLGRNRMNADDSLSALIERIVRSGSAIEGVSVEREAA